MVMGARRGRGKGASGRAMIGRMAKICVLLQQGQTLYPRRRCKVVARGSLLMAGQYPLQQCNAWYVAVVFDIKHSWSCAGRELTDWAAVPCSMDMYTYLYGERRQQHHYNRHQSHRQHQHQHQRQQKKTVSTTPPKTTPETQGEPCS